MNTFKKGDILLCIDDAEGMSPRFTKGQLYLVGKDPVGLDGPWFEKDDRGKEGYGYASRFRLHDKVRPEIVAKTPAETECLACTDYRKCVVHSAVEAPEQNAHVCVPGCRPNRHVPRGVGKPQEPRPKTCGFEHQDVPVFVSCVTADCSVAVIGEDIGRENERVRARAHDEALRMAKRRLRGEFCNFANAPVQIVVEREGAEYKAGYRCAFCTQAIETWKRNDGPGEGP